MCEEVLRDPFTDQVACARYKAERDALAQRMEEVASEIDRTLLGVEGIEDAPAMRWARGLREALGALHSPRTSYEDIEAARWVREHGGLDEVRMNCGHADNRRAERTCRVESSHEVEGDGCYSYFKYELTCGHEIAWGDQLPPSYCPECGRRVLYDSNDYI